MESLSAIQIKERGNRCVGNQCLLKLSSGAEFHQSLTLTGVDCCFHISCVTSDRVWVSDGINKLILTDTTGAPLHRVEDSCSCYVEGNGFHTVNSESELIYIGMNYNINKLSTDMRTTTTFIERTDSSWEPMCVYWSPSTVDLLVGMYNDFKETSKVTRYNQSGHLTQTIQHDNTGRGLYRKPCYITENNNGDVVVSDSDAVVVTEREGRHRFSYTGHPTGSGLRPHGICTDALSHILVCDELTKTVQMIDKNGQFLSDLLIRPSGIFGPKSLSYDINTHRLWVGSEVNKTVVIYRYITRKGSLTDRTYFPWVPGCVYSSPFTGDLLVGGHLEFIMTGKVSRYNQRGQLTQTMQYDNKGLQLYEKPRYITEINNGDVVVSDSDAVVVTQRGGRHRFSYTGHPTGSGLRPNGICTDALSHILVCDGLTETVQMIDKDGQFLSHLLIRPSGIFSPWSLSYDVNTHRLWVGSEDNNTVVIYRYITRKGSLTDQSRVMESLSGIPTPGTEKPQQGNQCLLKLTSGAEFHQSLTVTGVDGCDHISCVTSDRVWVSNGHNLILTDTTGVPLHRVEDSCSGYGLHTVNSESELIYIDMDDDINKLSKDMKTTTTFIESTDSTWRPWCVYWSPSTGDLLVGMIREEPRDDTELIWTCKVSDDSDDSDDTELILTAKVTRYNQGGQLTQTIKHDSTGQGLYSDPIYITENNNGDVVVSDLYAVVVTERGGRHRFSYTGPPSGSGLRPLGICTDALSHILVCDLRTKTVQMLDKDGQFLSHLLTESQEMREPLGLSYDVITHRLWVGSRDNKVRVYRYITRQDALTDLRVIQILSEIVDSKLRMLRNSRRWPWATYNRNSTSRGRISDPLSLVTRLDSSSSAHQ
uniref:Tripartite motif-containing protein 3 n=1 Tax=Magallana gigas TaxID=29159 RepID=K1QAS3_MAGGI